MAYLVVVLHKVEHLIEAPAAILDNDEDNLLEGSILFHRLQLSLSERHSPQVVSVAVDDA